jgi:transcription elongation factor Elf1
MRGYQTHRRVKMHTEPLCPYCGKEDFAVKKISLPQSTETADFIFCSSCGKIIGQPVYNYDLILEAIDGRLTELLSRK